MPLDGMFLHTVKNEIYKRAAGGRVDKIHQPFKDMLIITLRSKIKSENLKLLISTNSANARVGFTSLSLENPAAPPMFCMLLRKHIAGGKLTNIRQQGLDRAVYFDFEVTSELGDKVKITLACELMTRRANCILINQDGIIIDTLKRTNPIENNERAIFPGVKYKPISQQNKLNVTTASKDEIVEKISKTELKNKFVLPKDEKLNNIKKAEISSVKQENLNNSNFYKTKNLSWDKIALNNLQGVSPLTSREIVSRETINDERLTIYNERLTMNDEQLIDDGRHGNKQSCNDKKDNRFKGKIEGIVDFFVGFLGKPHFCMLMDGDVPKDFSFVPITQYGNALQIKKYDNASVLMEEFYFERDEKERQQQRAGDLLKFLKTRIERAQRKLETQKLEYKQSKERDKYKLYGELINANLHLLSKGQTKTKLVNYYKEDMPEIEIKLDARLTPVQNAQKYYSEYKKLLNAENILKELITQSKEELMYLESVYESVHRAKQNAEIDEIKEELVQSGYIKRIPAKNKKKKQKPLDYLRYTSPDGFTILCGRNNIQNDRLTFKQARTNDIWCHAKNVPGSHVVIITQGDEVPDATLKMALKIAAENSKARGSDNVPVDYTLVKNVRKPNGAKAGYVIYFEQKTVMVKMDN